MSIYKQRDKFYSMFFSKEGNNLSLIDYLDSSSFDEAVFVDYDNDLFTQLHHVDGKYFVPTLDNLSFKSIFNYFADHIIHPDDKEVSLYRKRG